MPGPKVQASSASAREQTPSLTRAISSRHRACIRRLAMKPFFSFLSTTGALSYIL